jgi:hypothetical protein
MEYGKQFQVRVEALQRQQGALALRNDPAWLLRYNRIQQQLASLHASPYNQGMIDGAFISNFEKTLTTLGRELAALSK